MAIGQNILMLIMCFMLASVCINKAFGRAVDSSSEPNACYSLVDVMRNTTHESYKEAIQDLAKKAEGLYNDANTVKSFLLAKYDVKYLEPEVIDYLDTTEYMDRISIKASIGMLDIKSTAADEHTNDTLKLHYTLVHEHIAYVSAARANGKISELSAELLKYEKSLHRYLCSVRIALIEVGYTERISTNNVEFNEEFEGGQVINEDEVYRAYIVVGDGLELSSNLKAAYVV